MIHSQRPVLALSAYHKWNDINDFIEIIDSAADDYRFFVRKYGTIFRYNWCEIVLYAIPVERMQ